MKITSRGAKWQWVSGWKGRHSQRDVAEAEAETKINSKCHGIFFNFIFTNNFKHGGGRCLFLDFLYVIREPSSCQWGITQTTIFLFCLLLANQSNPLVYLKQYFAKSSRKDIHEQFIKSEKGKKWKAMHKNSNISFFFSCLKIH